MASFIARKLFLLFLSFSLFCLASCSRRCNFDQIYQLGDSINDVGNLIREPVGSFTAFAKLPYGQTFFNNATGRCSNGLLMIDYFAMAAGISPLPPYKNMKTKFSHGVNFAVAGSTALPSEVLLEQRIQNPVTNSSLNVQLEWMSSHFDSICLDREDCSKKLENALFMVGEIGGNDYNYAMFQNKTMEELRIMIPDVVAAIRNAAIKVIGMGATRLVIPGNFPIGCLPFYKTAFQFQSNIKGAYDEHQCLRELNEFATRHNELVQQAIVQLKRENPNVVILYGDYYNAYQVLLRFGRRRGYEIEKACCGTGGKYNFDLRRMCGGDDVSVCTDVGRHLSWDGVHMTQQGYKIMARWLIRNLFPKLGCSN